MQFDHLRYISNPLLFRASQTPSTQVSLPGNNPQKDATMYVQNKDTDKSLPL